jgi:hypothetical protein
MSAYDPKRTPDGMRNDRKIFLRQHLWKKDNVDHWNPDHLH